MFVLEIFFIIIIYLPSVNRVKVEGSGGQAVTNVMVKQKMFVKTVFSEFFVLILF